MLLILPIYACRKFMEPGGRLPTQCHDSTDFIFHACIVLKSLIYTAVCMSMCVL